MADAHRLKVGEKVKIHELSTRGKDFHDNRAAADEELVSLRKDLAKYQERLYAEGKHRILIVLQAMDTAGKDGTVRDVFGGLNPQGIDVTSFKVPTAEERSRDFLWRIHRAVPPAGMIGIFNRSHYEDVLVVRVENLVPENVWRPRFEYINHFEELLTATGTVVLKFFLHISEEEQRQRLQERLEERRKQWKFSVEDVAKRKSWGDYMQAYDDVLERCTTAAAPWYVIPADQKWYRNLAVARVVVNHLKDLDPKFPQLAEGAKGMVIE